MQQQVQKGREQQKIHADSTIGLDKTCPGMEKRRVEGRWHVGSGADAARLREGCGMARCAPRLLLGVHLAAGLGRDAVCLGQSAVCLGQSVGGLGLEPDDDGVKRADKIEATLGSDGAGAAGEAL